MKKLLIALIAAALLAPGVAYAVNCNAYHEAIKDCTARRGCDTSIDEFADCLVSRHGISERAADGTNEVEELVHCFKTQYECR